MSIAQDLAKLHSSYGVYSSKSLQPRPDNILTGLNLSPSFTYLRAFFDLYVESYGDKISTEINDKKARSKDLFFVGEDVVTTATTKFFFVFEGSLSAKEKTSITVLAHLWLLEDDDPVIKDFFGKDKWWDSSYDYFNVKNKLKICRQFALDSYVTDAIRVQTGKEYNDDKKSNDIKNRELLYDEIKLLKPKLVICVGKTAKEIVGMRYLDQDTKFHSVRFPKYHNEVDGYVELYKIMAQI